MSPSVPQINRDDYGLHRRLRLIPLNKITDYTSIRDLSKFREGFMWMLLNNFNNYTSQSDEIIKLTRENIYKTEKEIFGDFLELLEDIQYAKIKDIINKNLYPSDYNLSGEELNKVYDVYKSWYRECYCEKQMPKKDFINMMKNLKN